MNYQLLQGDCIEVMRTLPANSVQMVCTSPPYFGLRAYLDNGDPNKPLEIGTEETPEAYVAKLVDVFREVRRVLRDDGTLWLNLGSSYASSDTRSNQSHHVPHVPAYDNDGKGFPGYQDADRACHDSCDEPTSETQNHRARNARNDQSAEQGARLPLPIDRDSGHLDFGPMSQSAFAPGVQESTTPESSSQLPGASSLRARALADPSKLDSYAPGVQESAHKEQNIPGKSLTSQTLVDRKSDMELSDSALSSPKEPTALTYLYSTIASLDFKAKQLIPIPWLVALALQADGWILRSEIIWAKKSPMPESVTDRPTRAHEQVFLLAKQASYYYDAAAIAEPVAREWGENNIGVNNGWVTGEKTGKVLGRKENPNGGLANSLPNADGTRNRRSVWTLGPEPYSGAHFAVMPTKLVEPCILAGTSAHGCCAKCGAPWARVVERTNETRTIGDPSQYKSQPVPDDPRIYGGNKRAGDPSSTTLGWQPTCTCNADVVPCTVLDPFNGAATTGIVALKHGRNYVGIDLNPEYLELSRQRMERVQPTLFELTT